MEYYNENEIDLLITRFEARTLPKEEWTHRAHLVVAIWYSSKFNFEEALKLTRQNISKYNESIGTANTDSSGYHETLTRFWLWTAQQFLKDKEQQTIANLCNDFINASMGQRAYPLEFYSKEKLFSVHARRHWVEPDIKLINSPEMNTYQILNTEDADLAFVYHLFEEAIAYHKRNNYPVWRGYDKAVLDVDRTEKRQYKILIDGEIAFLFSVCYDDEIVWREKNADAAVYMHRMVVNPKFKGKKLAEKAFDWAKGDCAKKGLKFIRLDTWADNPNIIAYYQSFGFNIVEYFSTPDSPDLPLQQRGNKVVLMEIELQEN